MLIFVIDDAGNNYSQLEPFLKLPFPLTVAVLPDLPFSTRDAEAVRAAGKELILHQPMQPLGTQNPGPGELKIGMDASEVERTIENNLRTVPGAVGMNNHMGSAATSNLELMEKVASVAKAKGIYYLDSLTVSGSAVPEAAQREGIRYWERSVFLDNSSDKASIVRAVEDGKRRAAKNGSAVMIGHVWSADLAQTLMDLYPQLVAEGFSLSTISRFMLSEAASDDESTGN
ncbi:MAG TPA: divergent polysaccharide deacetylase family protein [Rectinemataceae bacterium]|nr:divergent polysaccharide deacetylase family protein [Rectinemataceae bacterium]